MNIHKFVLVWLSGLVLLALALAGSYYLVERNLLLHTVADSLNRSFFSLEREIQNTLQNGRWQDVQAMLDETAAINHSIAELSVSLNGEQIDVSSSRSLRGDTISADYRPVSQLYTGLSADSHSRFKSDFPYFKGAEKRAALLLVRVDEDYVFGRMNQVALYYGAMILALLGVLTLIVFILVRRLLVFPLETITQLARQTNTRIVPCYITEFAELNHALSDSFQSLKDQQHQLQTALDETRYLDGILRTVADINQLLITSKTGQELLERSTARLAQHTGYGLCWIALEQKGYIQVSAVSSAMDEALQVGMTLAAVTNESDNAVGQAFIERRSIVMDHLAQHASIQQSWRLIAERGQYGAFIALPLMSHIHEAPIGILGLYAHQPEGFTPKEIEMLEELAGDIGFAIRAFEQRAQLEYHLTTDPITNLPNRTALVDRLAADFNVMLAIVNIDRFSDINEVYGITIGDGLLASYAQWLSKQIESQNGISLFKVGGDEYVLLFSGWKTLELCRNYLEQLVLASAKETFTINGINILITITIGFAEASDRILEHATAALRLAKINRRSLQLYITPTSKRIQESNIAWYKRIKSAIDESRIVPYFQPIVDNQTREVIKYEALVRLIEQDGSVVGPHAFLDIAKKTRLYGQITQIMIEKTAQVFKNSTLSVSINLSTEDLLNHELADLIEAVILTNHLGQIITFEILESEGIENYAEVSAFVDRFKSLGCRFAIDDFGSGYSNFDHLLKLNVDTLKIDGSLIKNLTHDRNARIFVQHIRDFAQEMGIHTVAEFVANEEIYLQVKALGIDASQGYFFYEPSATLISPKE